MELEVVSQVEVVSRLEVVTQVERIGARADFQDWNQPAEHSSHIHAARVIPPAGISVS